MQRASSQHWSLLRYSATLPIAIYSIASAGSLVGSFFAQLFSFSTEGLPNDVSRVSSFSPSYARAVVGEEILLSLFNIVPLLSLSCPVCCPDFLEIGLYLSKLQSFMIVCAVPFGVLFSIIPCFQGISETYRPCFSTIAIPWRDTEAILQLLPVEPLWIEHRLIWWRCSPQTVYASRDRQTLRHD